MTKLVPSHGSAIRVRKSYTTSVNLPDTFAGSPLPALMEYVLVLYPRLYRFNAELTQQQFGGTT